LAKAFLKKEVISMRKKVVSAVHVGILGLLAVLALAPAVQTDDEQVARDKAALQNFQGLNFGLGVGVVATPSQRVVKSAQVVNGLVRADDQSQATASILLETHYFIKNDDHPLWSHGPLVAIKPGGTNSQIIDTIGLSSMFGFRHKEASKSSWNIGFAGTITPAARVLGDGITKNQPLPAGETEVRYKTSSVGGFMIMASFSWNSFE
jgi:hypothetical protein